MTHAIVSKTARGAASATVKALNKEAVKMGSSPSAFIRVDFPDGSNTVYNVVWEHGPFEWSIIATGEGDIWGEELTGSLTKAYNMPATLDFKHGRGGKDHKYLVECANSYTLTFGKDS